MATGGYERLPDHDDYDQQIEFQTMQKEKSCFAAS